MTDAVIPQFVPYWGREEAEAVSKVLGSDYLNEHETVREFEREFAAFVGARHCVAVTSGTAALYCAACAAFPEAENGGGRGGVLVPAHDGIFAFNAARAAGARPVVCDVDGHGLLSEPKERGGAGGGEKEEEAQSIVVHANGRISSAARLVEDCAQAIDHHTPNRISTYSFASTKHLTTGGQGGAVCCDDGETFDLLARLKDHGRSDRQHLRPMSDSYDRWGMNFKMTEMQAAFGLAQLRTLRRRTRRFGEMHRMYRDLLGGAVAFDDVEPRWYVDVFTPHAGHVKDALREKGIHCRAYPRPLHLQGVARGCAYTDRGDAFASAEKRHATGLYLPSTTNLSDEDVHRVAAEVKSAAAAVAA